MKTTIEIADSLYRQVKARASLKGQTVKAFFVEALQEKLRKEAETSDRPPGWMKAFGKAPESSVAEVQAIIDDEFSRIGDR